MQVTPAHEQPTDTYTVYNVSHKKQTTLTSVINLANMDLVGWILLIIFQLKKFDKIE